MTRIRLFLVVAMLLVPVTTITASASASPDNVLCSVLKAEPIPPVNDLSPSLANVKYFSSLSRWATKSEAHATSPNIHSIFAHLSTYATAVSSWLLKAHNASGFSTVISRSYYLTHAALAVVQTNVYLRAGYNATHSFCP